MGLGWDIHNLRFHMALYASRLGWNPGDFTEVSAEPMSAGEQLPRKLRVHFWVPRETAGSMVIIDNVLPPLRNQLEQLGVDWELVTSTDLPDKEVDWLFCFKSVPQPRQVPGNPRRVLLICDQAEVFWKDVPAFHEVLATSSPQFARLLAWRHDKVSYLSETEPEIHLGLGRQVLAGNHPKEPVLLWHGGTHSLKALYALKPQLIDWAQPHPEACLQIVCGSGVERTEHWGKLTVRYFPWSVEQLHASARIARLAIIPAINRLKHSWLKPASRVRCCYALGVPAIGDRHVPEVEAFAESFGGPVAKSLAGWRAELENLWGDADERNRLAKAGHAKVETEFSTPVAIRRWIRYLAKPRPMVT